MYNGEIVEAKDILSSIIIAFYSYSRRSLVKDCAVVAEITQS